MSSEAAITAVHRFTTHGDSTANQELLHLVDHSLDVGGTNAAHTIAPQLLQWALSDSTASASSADLLYVAVLNRHFCLRVVLDHLAQPLDRRPSGLAELQQLYLAALRTSVPEAARTQLTQCVACLLIVSEDRLAELLSAWVRGGGETGSDAAVPDCRTALHVFIAAVDLLVDRRVRFGSIRRATQRRQLQERLNIVLQSPLQGGEEMPLLLRATATAIRFLLEAMYGEPQEVAEAFWAELPASAVWRYCLSCLAAPSTPSPPAVLDLVCSVLRCLTIIDAPAEALLLDALPAVLQPVTSAPTAAEWEAISRTIAAALEASTEAILTTQPPDAPLFRLFSAAAERLAQVLQAPAAPATAVNHVCEGISALTQVLQPAPLPEMEATDDPEDFAEVVASMREANATKETALTQLRPFLVACEATVATRLVQSGFAQAEWRGIAEYVAQRTADGDAEDFQIVHEEAALALYTTYERLSRLLGPLAADVLHTITAVPEQQLVLVTVDADLAVQWLHAVEPSALLAQSALLPTTVARFAGSSPGLSPRWSANTLLTVVSVLLRAVASYEETAWNDGTPAEAVLAVADAAVAAVLAVKEAGFDANELRQRCMVLVSLLWRCATTTTKRDERRVGADHLSSLLQRGVAVLPDSAVQTLVAQDAYTQALLFASGAATSSSMDTVACLAHTLDCLAQLPESEADAMLTRVLDGMAARVRQHCEAGDWPAAEVAEVLTAWHTRSPNSVLCFLKLSAALPPSMQPTVLLSGMTRFFECAENRDVATADLVAMLAAPFVQPIADTALTAPALSSLLRWLLQPHPAFTVSDGGRRVRALAACGRVVYAGGHVSPGEAVEALLPCVARWQEYVAATALSGPADEKGDDDVMDGENGAESDAQVTRAVHEELAVWGRCVPQLAELPSGAPAWLSRLQRAEDDYERMEVLKGI